MIEQGNGEHKCFFCLKPIDGPQVRWDEQNNWRDNPEGEGLTKVYLHPKCSIQLGCRLIGDAFQADPQVEDQSKVKLWVRTRMPGGRIYDPEDDAK